MLDLLGKNRPVDCPRFRCYAIRWMGVELHGCKNANLFVQTEDVWSLSWLSSMKMSDNPSRNEFECGVFGYLYQFFCLTLFDVRCQVRPKGGKSVNNSVESLSASLFLVENHIFSMKKIPLKFT